ncbi:MAG: cobalt-precorrin-6A reductase [Solirubrobacteraceae bacterium]|nr:cobalt-precorrin-6A reductase [Solirubrobacteraceae bacterium]
MSQPSLLAPARPPRPRRARAVVSTVLILGGTGEARDLAALLAAVDRQPHGVPVPPAALERREVAELRVVSSLAGRVARPRLPVGEVRIGGFGGPERMASWLRAEGVGCVVDATHPFAERISASAALATAAAGIPLLRLQRPGWEQDLDDVWHWVDSLPEAASLLPELGRRVFLTTGRQGLRAFTAVDDAHFLIRCVDPPEPADLPADHELLLARGPYTVEGELALIDRHRLDVIVTKDSGGRLTAAKLDAARTRRLPVIVVRRPGRPQLPEVATATDAAAWVRARLR